MNKKKRVLNENIISLQRQISKTNHLEVSLQKYLLKQ
jgi:hypothetical protein